MAEFERVAKVSDVAPGEIKSFPLGIEMIAVCKVDGRIYAFKDECSHQALPLSDGVLEGKTITCAYHGAEFDIETGKAICLPATDGVETYEVKVEGDYVCVLIPD